jgi:hypothetical protein
VTSTYQIANGDIVLNRATGQVSMVSDLVKAKQDVRENILIDIQTDNGFGAGLTEMIGDLPSDEITPGTINFNFGYRVQRAFQRMIQLQRSYQFGQRTALELINKILFIRAEPSKTDPTLYRFLIRLQTLAGARVSVGGGLAL